MTARELIQEHAWNVGEALQEYIKVDDLILSESGSTLSLLKNLIGKGRGMSELLKHAEALLPTWDGICDRLASFEQDLSPTLSEGEHAYVTVLIRYAEAVRFTVQSLVDLQRHQVAGANRDKSYSWETFKERTRKYRAAVLAYQAIGKELNDMRLVIFDY